MSATNIVKIGGLSTEVLMADGSVSSFNLQTITKTKAEIDALISANELIPGSNYKITGVHPDLYNDSNMVKKLYNMFGDIPVERGSGYVNGTYDDIPVIGGSGSGLIIDMTIFSGYADYWSVKNLGVGYSVGDILTIDNTHLGGTGSGFSYTVSERDFFLFNETYLGTTIYLQALTTNTLTKEGYGEFWNPKYIEDENDANDNKGIYTNVFAWDLSVTSGTFNRNENWTADNGATGTFVGTINTNKFVVLSGDPTTITSIIGDETGATGNVFGLTTQPGYSTGTKVLWGGYSWINLNGNLGKKIDLLTLDEEWFKNGYNSTDYNKVYDVIEYDYENDWIQRRYEVKSGNDVSNTYINHQAFNSAYGLNNSISVFMFGNESVVYVNIIKDSYFESVDFNGAELVYNKFTGNSKFYDNIYDGSSIVYKNNVDNSNILGNNILFGSSITENIVSYSSEISGNCLYNNSTITNNTLNNESSINNNDVINSSVLANYLEDSNQLLNKLNNSLIRENKQISSGLNENILSSGIIEFNNIGGNCLIENNTLTSSALRLNILKLGSSIELNILTSSNIFSNELKQTSEINENTLTSSGEIAANSLIRSSINSNILNSGKISKNNSIISVILSNELSSSAIIEENILNNNSYITSNIFISGDIQKNNLVTESGIQSNNGNYAHIFSNLLSLKGLINSNTISDGGSISKNTINSESHINSNTIASSAITSNTLINGTILDSNNISVGGSIDRNTFDSTTITSNIVVNGSFLLNTFFSSNFMSNDVRSSSSINGNSIKTGNITDNVLTNSAQIASNDLKGGNIGTNTMDNFSTISANVLTTSHITNNTILAASLLEGNDLHLGSRIDHNSLDGASHINDNTLNNNSTLNYITLVSASMINKNSFTFSLLQLSNTLSAKTIAYAILEKANVNANLPSATVIYASYVRTIYTRPDNANKIRYYNDSDVLVIAEITD
jgi:hypothetical protein